MRHISYKSILTALIISLVFTSLSPSMLYAEGASNLGSEDILAADNEESADFEEKTESQPEPEYNVSPEAAANSFRFAGGLLIDGAETDGLAGNAGIAPLSIDFQKNGNTWSKNGDTYFATGTDGSSGMTVVGAKGLGIDVSSWQGNIDWAAVKQSGIVDYAIIRCGWGDDMRSQDDSQFLNNVRGCLNNGIPFGIYIYSYAYNTSMAQSEASHVLRLLGEAGLSPSKVAYPIYLDLEQQDQYGRPAGMNDGQYHAVSNQMLEQIASTFCTAIENAGYSAGVYANTNWWTNYLVGLSFANWSKWVAQYNTSCTYSGSYDMWQCMSNGRVPGINGNVDIDFDFVGLEQIGVGQTAWSRIYGQNQLDTMCEISKKGWTNSSTVVIATDGTYWDALTASSLAGAYGCPILLTHGNDLSEQTKAEIKRLGAKTAYVCGGPIAIASRIDDQIKAAGCSNVVRVYGQDQQGTACAIAERVRTSAASKTCIIATSRAFQDSLSISPYAYAYKAPIFLCESGSNRLSNATLAAIRKGGYTSAIIVGGPIAVEAGVESQLGSVGITSSQRIYGQTEYETSLSIAKWELTQGMTSNNMAVATGVTFYDALAGSALCGKNNSVLVIASDYNRVCLTDFVGNQAKSISNGYVFGGPIAVSQSTWNALLKAYLY